MSKINEDMMDRLIITDWTTFCSGDENIEKVNVKYLFSKFYKNTFPCIFPKGKKVSERSVTLF